MRYRINQSYLHINHQSDNTIEVDGLLLTIDDIRLIVDETQKIVLCSSMQKDLVQRIDHNTSTKQTRITFATSLITLATTDKITFEVDLGGAPAGDATALNQERMLMALNVADQIPELTPMTDEEILKAYDGYDVAGEHTMGIADQTYGHLVPAEVTIDSVPFTMYQERTYAAYGYTTLYDAQGQQININKHPEEGEHLFTVQPEPEPDPVNVTIDGVAAEVDSTKTYAENGYSAIYKNNDAADATADYPQEGDVLVTDPNVVDLGLSVLWCRTNLGAETQTSVGPYYPWGKKNGYTPNAQGVFEQAYFTSDAYATLPNATNNDAIYEQSDGAYRMPTKEEFNELKANTHMTALASSYAFVATDGRGSVVLPRNNSAETDRIVEHQSSDQPMIWTSSSESFGAKAAIGRSSAGSSLTIGRASAFCGLQLRGVKPIQNNN